MHRKTFTNLVLQILIFCTANSVVEARGFKIKVFEVLLRARFFIEMHATVMRRSVNRDNAQ